MLVVNVRQAKSQLSRLLIQVEAGDEVVIARRGHPVARLIRYTTRGKRQFGAMSKQIVVEDSILDPLPEDELAAWEA